MRMLQGRPMCSACLTWRDVKGGTCGPARPTGCGLPYDRLVVPGIGDAAAGASPYGRGDHAFLSGGSGGTGVRLVGGRATSSTCSIVNLIIL
ncbi:hypothetical protein DVU_1938 [Nitratidesulfovibrio vulgaris str. Hildenborough]|uniref:Uncharacterized protein n=1 Tax=Nitratidesulfovibrio vulgaris (strain ATCC 29579 / DSM 644 / CCUG 34227 / NCIMB 8303 / VKM B-1760 / Hildenborough) TaxID=882 RepID=Q72AQ4_NITV2|nr:hypothetical protein DVU_1938 [Nitratidesulfovibrio vulgaris str. Hildenborough]